MTTVNSCNLALFVHSVMIAKLDLMPLINHPVTYGDLASDVVAMEIPQLLTDVGVDLMELV